jgi:alkanesulfonate monooxygenase SsuD/methylene tetrahydromethanopterin reductase-like flavin-dependent oxidoreductase (luciferase family)
MGKHFKLEETTFQPKPYQTPRIPIWVGGFWPARKPYRRAAKYDGTYPERNWPDKLTITDLKVIKSYITKHRKRKEPFDFCVGGETSTNKNEAVKLLEPWINAGATWWSENVNGWGGSLKEMRKRIKGGPPRL